MVVGPPLRAPAAQKLHDTVASYHTPGYSGHVPGTRTLDAVGRTPKQLLVGEPLPSRIVSKIGPTRIPGYSGYVPGRSDNQYGMSFCRSLSENRLIPDPPYSARGAPGSESARPGTEIPGYSGWVTGKIDSHVMGGSIRNIHDKLAAAEGRQPTQKIERSQSDVFATPRTPRWSPEVEATAKAKELVEAQARRGDHPAALPPQAVVMGYSGHMAGMVGDPVPGQTRSRAYAVQATHLGLTENSKKVEKGRVIEHRRLAAEVPGYTGFVRGKKSEPDSVGVTYRQAADSTVPRKPDIGMASGEETGYRSHRAIVGYKGHVPRTRAEDCGVGTSFAQGQLASARGKQPKLDRRSQPEAAPPLERRLSGGRPVRTMPGDALQRPTGSRSSSRASSPGSESSYASSVGSRYSNGMTPRR